MLNNTQKHYLKSLAQRRKPYVTVGSNGLTQAVLNEIDLALKHHELIKIKVYAKDRQTREEWVEKICQVLGAELVQKVGHIAILFRRNSEKSRIQLP